MRAISEHVPLRPQESFLAYRYCGENFYTPYHYHPEYEIVMIEAGRGTRVVGDHTGSFGPLDLCFFGGGLPHFFHADEARHGAISWVVQFRLEILRGLLELPEMAGLKPLLSASQEGLSFSRASAERVAPSLRQLPEAKGQERIILLMEVLAVLAADEAAQPLASPGYLREEAAASSQRLAKAWNLLLHDFDRDLTQAEVAKELKMSVSAFSRLFRRMTGNTFSETLILVRLGKVCRLLADQDVTIAEACYQSGFRNLSIFNRHFKRRYGMTPREWRRQCEPQADVHFSHMMDPVLLERWQQGNVSVPDLVAPVSGVMKGK